MLEPTFSAVTQHSLSAATCPVLLFSPFFPFFAPTLLGSLTDTVGGKDPPKCSPSSVLDAAPRCCTKAKSASHTTPAFSSRQATTCATRRRPADASIGALCRYQPDTGTCVAKARRRSTCSSSIKRHERHSRRLLKWTRREDIFQGGSVSQEAQPTNPCSHRTAIIKVK